LSNKVLNNDTIIFPSNTPKNRSKPAGDLYVRRFKNGRWSAVSLGKDARKAIDDHQLKYLALYRSGPGYGYIEDYAEITKYEKIDNQNLNTYDLLELPSDVKQPPKRPKYRIFLRNIMSLPHKVGQGKVITGHSMQGCHYTTLEKLLHAKNMDSI
jgi:hypothetical protein